MGIGRWIGVALLAVTGALYLHSKNVNSPDQGKDVERAFPLAVLDRQTQVPQFTATASGTYLIELEFQTAGHASGFQVAGPHYLLGCMTGILKDPVQCKDQPDLLDVTWSVTSDERVVALGAASDFEGEGSTDEANRTITRVIGRFRASRGEPYVLKLNLHLAPPDLASGETKLRVRPEMTDGGQAAGGFESILMLLLGGGGLALLWLGGGR